MSLTRSFRIAADYATHNGNREGVVFKIDGTRLHKHGEVFDAYASMVSHCEPMSDDSHLKTLNEVVKALRPLKAGRFLERCNEEPCETRLGMVACADIPKLSSGWPILARMTGV